MLELSVYTKFNLVICDTTAWESYARLNGSACFIAIVEGSGHCTIDGVKYPYEKDFQFLIPADCVHSFSPTQKTSVFVILYGLLKEGPVGRSKISRSDYNDLLINVDTVLASEKIVQGELIRDLTDRDSARQMMLQIIKEMEARKASYKLITEYSVFLLLNILVRYYLAPPVAEPAPKKSEMDRVVEYIKRYIDEKEKLKLEQIAQNTQLAEAEINENFSSYTGYSVKSFIIKCQTDKFKSKLLNIDLLTSK